MCRCHGPGSPACMAGCCSPHSRLRRPLLLCSCEDNPECFYVVAYGTFMWVARTPATCPVHSRCAVLRSAGRRGVAPLCRSHSRPAQLRAAVLPWIRSALAGGAPNRGSDATHSSWRPSPCRCPTAMVRPTSVETGLSVPVSLPASRAAPAGCRTRATLISTACKWIARRLWIGGTRTTEWPRLPGGRPQHRPSRPSLRKGEATACRRSVLLGSVHVVPASGCPGGRCGSKLCWPNRLPPAAPRCGCAARRRRQPRPRRRPLPWARGRTPSPSSILCPF